MRKQWLIFPKFQFTLIWANLLCFGVMGVIVAGLTRLSFSKLIDMGGQAALASNHPYYKFVEFQSALLYKHLFMGFMISALVSTVITLLVSNKLAGPLYRLRLHLTERNAGKTDLQIKFRKGDFLGDEFADLVNGALEKQNKAS